MGQYSQTGEGVSPCLRVSMGVHMCVCLHMCMCVPTCVYLGCESRLLLHSGAPKFTPGHSVFFHIGTDLCRPAAQSQHTTQSFPECLGPVPRILQARTLEWVAISFSNA